MNFRSVSFKTIAALGFVATAAASHAATVILDFDPAVACGATACINEAPISSTYGSTAELAVNFAPSSLNLASYWGADYGTLSGVAYQNNLYVSGTGTASTDPLTISFTAAAGFAITGFSFDYATYQGSTLPVSFSLDVDGAPYSSGTLTALQSAGITPGGLNGPFGSANSLVFKFGPDNWTAGVDNITIQVSAVPEPGEWAMMLAGLGVVSAIARKRRKTVAA
jgi:hypothetical protein